MGDFLAMMIVPIQVDLDVDAPTMLQKERIEQAIAEDLKANGYGGATLSELIRVPATQGDDQ